MQTYTNDELYHSGVLGMKWGVRRATNRLSKATTAADRDKAVSSLNKHREKATAKVAKLEKKRPKLEQNVEKQITKNDVKATKLQQKAAHKRNKGYNSLLMSQSRRQKNIFKADRLQAKADTLKAESEKAKAALAKNESMQNTFKQGINRIDQALIDNGRKYLED